ncbi:MAG: capsule biosynthesis protein [Pseudomonadota bacterium]
MTTEPKSRRFRLRRSAGAASPNRKAQQHIAQPAPTNQMSGAPTPTTPSMTSAKGTPPQTSQDAIEAVRREGLTGRQLRMARRVAQKNGLAPQSDFEAVHLLRAKGIDPFQRANMLELVVPPEGDTRAPHPPKGEALSRIQLPQTIPSSDVTAPQNTELSPVAQRQQEIAKIQREILRRRQRKLGLLLVRLAFFVFLPTAALGYYFYSLATPMYATTSQFLIIQNEGGGGGSAFGSLLPTQFANSADSIATQAYLQSKDAMLRLDADRGFKDHFSDTSIDPLQRLEPDATNEATYKIYKRNVKIGYDPTEGVIRMEVVAADPEVSAEFSRKLLTYAEERVNELSLQKREDAMRDARIGFEKAQENRRRSQEKLITLQVENGVDPEAEIAALRSQITNVDTQIIEKEIELSALLDNARPNAAKVDGARGDIRRLNEQLQKLNERLNSATAGENSLAQRAVAIQLAQADLANADLMLQSSQTSMEQAQTEANRQVRYLTVAVSPVPPQEPTYPRKFENTIMAFLVFTGIYLMLSLTASILREQVAS